MIYESTKKSILKKQKQKRLKKGNLSRFKQNNDYDILLPYKIDYDTLTKIDSEKNLSIPYE